MYGLRFSMSDYREQENITNVPLYGARGYLVNVLNKWVETLLIRYETKSVSLRYQYKYLLK